MLWKRRVLEKFAEQAMQRILRLTGIASLGLEAENTLAIQMRDGIAQFQLRNQLTL
jgi:hypothetical protein